jgi:predicted phage-related endonuclease
MKISNVEQGSLDWHDLRHGKVTGSKLKGLFGIRTARQTLLKTIVAERMTEVDLDNFCGRKMEWGNQWEPVAIEKSSEERGIDFETCGMMVSEEMEGFGLSPDGVYYEGGEMVGGIETKAPDIHTHVGYLLEDELPKEYKWQVYGNFIMSDKIEWWDFASFDPRNYSRPLFMIRTYRKDIEDEIKDAKEKLIVFLKDINEAHQGLIF